MNKDKDHEKHEHTEEGGRFDTRDIVSHEDTTGEQVAGGVGGAAVGAAWGTLAGPVGTIVGGLAGAVGGWWAARSATEQHLGFIDDENYYAKHHQNLHSNTGGASRRSMKYEDARPAYQLGHLAGANPDYADRSFDDVEPELRNAYSNSSLGPDSWDDVRGYVHAAFGRGREVSPVRGANNRPTP